MLRKYFSRHHSERWHPKRESRSTSTTPKSETRQEKTSAPVHLPTPPLSKEKQQPSGIPSTYNEAPKAAHAPIHQPARGKISDIKAQNTRGLFSRFLGFLTAHKNELNLLKNKCDVLYNTRYKRSAERKENEKKAIFDISHLKRKISESKEDTLTLNKPPNIQPRLANQLNSRLGEIQEEDLTKPQLTRGHSS